MIGSQGSFDNVGGPTCRRCQFLTETRTRYWLGIDLLSLKGVLDCIQTVGKLVDDMTWCDINIDMRVTPSPLHDGTR